MHQANFPHKPVSAKIGSEPNVPVFMISGATPLTGHGGLVKRKVRGEYRRVKDKHR